ncbi:hypothetical protein BD324DRAFT_618919 [Kockovaella imperatae]|uniref:Ion transport domain-containing protein n=1 Tax=Kockovaella imperatae TaxID=4999 RepID=A0A1Y1UMF0_9TREE|nr:hypothetical protein BD324DRAFT_618919 [Kockovaella imperatae]ORX39230.1 hypothetical protein BD324DRAFT_618919 [Kockovaella imperatae]
MSTFPYLGTGEQTPLLGPQSAISSKQLIETKVYPLIHLIRTDIISHIDTPLTYEQLHAPDSTYTIVRPLTEKYLELQNQSIIFCLLLNKIQFTRDSAQLSISTLSTSRATLCEVLAIRVLRGWSERTLPLATVLLTPWALYQGASPEVIARAKEEGDDDILNQNGAALEMAIISYSKRFIRSPSCQKVIEGIWSGRIIYSGVNSHALIADNYKKKPIQMYNPHKAPLLDHYRLKVPKVRSFLEYTNFLILFILYVVAVEGLEEDRMNKKEAIFIIYALAYSLDKLATIREHGLGVFSSSLVNGFDLVLMLIYAIYLGARMYGFHYHNAEALTLGQDWLAIGAVMIFPRLAFVTLANNLMVLSIRSMLVEFFFLMAIGIFCFLGFLYALFTLGQGRFELSQIGWWLLEVYFGLDASGFETSHDLHPFLGPVLMVTYALLSNTLLLTVLVAILGNTFATINQDAAAESMFRKAVSTLEGVKADAVFSYQLPFNLVAVVFMWPMSYILNPRWFHKLNVAMIRLSNFPVLIVIALYERQQYRETTLMETVTDFIEKYVGSIPRRIKQAAGFENFGSRHDISLLFEIEREVGTFYRDSEEDEGDDVQLPPAFSDDEAQAGNIIDHAPFTASPSKTSFSPAKPPSAGPVAPLSPVAMAGPSHRRRNSSIYEPSPLARLFVAAPDGAQDIRPRRQSMRAPAVGSLPNTSSAAMVTSYSISPSQSGGMSRRQQQQAQQAPQTAHLHVPHGPHLASSLGPSRVGPPPPSIPTIQESNPSTPAASPKRAPGSLGVPFPSAGGKASDIVAKASDVDRIEEAGGVLEQKLEQMDQRQKRMEDMLSHLIDQVDRKRTRNASSSSTRTRPPSQ